MPSLNNPRWKSPGKLPSYVLLALALALPLVMVVHAVFATGELNEMRSIFLRDRAANIAARLEAMPADRMAQSDFDELLEGDPSLLRIHIFRPSDSDAGHPALGAIRAGRQLYRTEEIHLEGEAVFRAYIPFHSATGVHVARIDLSRNAPDFILIHARHNLVMAIVGGSVLLLVSFYAVWTTWRAARLERRRLEMESLAQLGTLSAVLAHEIRNPLGAIKGFAQLAREQADPGRLKPLDAIVRESRRLENLVNALLLYGRPVEPAMRETDWEPVAAELAVHAREAIGARPVRFLSESRIERLRTDPDLLKQALVNLIRNAVEAVPDSGDGLVQLRAVAGKNGAVLISVEDNGPGIPEQVRAKLFSPFVTTKASGTGLGLSISKKVVETLGGSLHLLPVEPHGTKAEVALHGTNSGN